MPGIDSPVRFACGNGGEIETSGALTGIAEIAVRETGWVEIDDIHIDATDNLVIGLDSADMDTDGDETVGNTLANLDISPGGTSASFDLRIIELTPGNMYEFYLDGSLATWDNGDTRQRADDNGEVLFTGVQV